MGGPNKVKGVGKTEKLISEGTFIWHLRVSFPQVTYCFDEVLMYVLHFAVLPSAKFIYPIASTVLNILI